MSGGYTRLTVQGTARKAEVVVPDDEPVAELLPQLLDLLAEDRSAGARPLSLISLLGTQIDPARSLGQQHVMQGALLRLVRVDQAPPPPEVGDVTDVVAATMAGRADRWQPVWTHALAAALAAIAGCMAAVVTTRSIEPDALVTARFVLALAVLAVIAARLRPPGPGVPPGSGRPPGPGVVLAAGAAGAWAGLSPGIADRLAAGIPAGTALTGWAGVCLIVAAVAGAGLRQRAAAMGALAGAVLAVSALVLDPVTGPAGGAAATVVLCALVLGVLPGWAMTVSGLNGLDDRAVAGQRLSRRMVQESVDETYRALTWSTVAVSVVAAITGLALVVRADTWSPVLAGLAGLLVLLRARVLPLVMQRLALWAVAAVILAGWADTWAASAPEAVVVSASGVVVLAAVVAGVTLSPPVAARARRAASVLELLAAVAIVPVLLAQLGVFADLLSTF